MYCDQCGTDNPEINRFCGACGAALFRRPELWRPPSERQSAQAPSETRKQAVPSVPAPVQTVPEPQFTHEPVRESSTVREPVASERHESAEPVVVAEREPYVPISGPSLLGLSGSPDDDSSDSSYLVEETPRRRLGWLVFALVAAAILVTFGFLEYRTITSGKVNLPWFSSNNTGSDNASSEQPQQAAGNENVPPPDSSAQPTTPQPLTSDEASGPPAPQASTSNPHPGPASGAVLPSNSGATKNTDNAGRPSMEVVQKKPAAPVSKPDQPADKSSDESSTQEATARAAQQADAKRKQEMAAAIDKDETPTPDASSGPASKATDATPKPSRSTTEDPRKNPLLLKGEQFLYGRGGRRDCNQAVTYFREAAKQYNGPAMTHLGAMYASGNCVQQNRLEAYKWFSRAQEAQPNNQWLGRNMNMLWRQMTPEERASVSR